MANDKSKKIHYECSVIIAKENNKFKGKLLSSHNNVAFDTKERIQDLINDANIKGIVIDIKEQQKTFIAPLLLDTKELQREGQYYFDYVPDKTLAIAQSLYEKDLITNPDTNCRYLSIPAAKELFNNLKSVARVPMYSKQISSILTNPYVKNRICKQENDYVKEHETIKGHAIIPTSKVFTFTDLNEMEKNIYKLIVRRAVAIFMPAKVINTIRVVCKFGRISTLTTVQKIERLGYGEIIPDSSEKNILPELKEGDNVSIIDAEGEIVIDDKDYEPETFLENSKNNNFQKEDKKRTQYANTDAICPLCGRDIKESKTGFYCEGWEDKSCNYFMRNYVYGATITSQDFKAMLAGEKIGKRFTWNSGKRGCAKIGIINNKYRFFFEE